jgi:hypothetical protein
MINFIQLYLALSTFDITVNVIQERAEFISVVEITNLKIDDAIYFKAVPVQQIRGYRADPFRVWVEGTHFIAPGKYVLFYNLCDSIGYPVFKQEGLFKIEKKAISFQTEVSYETVRVRLLKKWLSSNGMWRKIFFHECLGGRKGLPMNQ